MQERGPRNVQISAKELPVLSEPFPSWLGSLLVGRRLPSLILSPPWGAHRRGAGLLSNLKNWGGINLNYPQGYPSASRIPQFPEIAFTSQVNHFHSLLVSEPASG